MRRATTPPEVRIATGRLVLRPVAESDFDRIVAELNDFAVTRWLARVPYPYTRVDAAAFLDSTRRRSGKDVALAVTRDGAVIGGMGLTGVDAEREFGYWLGSAHWGQGLATEAAGAFLSYCFETLRLETIRSGVFVGNDASLRVQEKLGFVRTGTRTVHCLARAVDLAHIDTILTRERFAVATAPLA